VGRVPTSCLSSLMTPGRRRAGSGTQLEHGFESLLHAQQEVCLRVQQLETATQQDPTDSCASLELDQWRHRHVEAYVELQSWSDDTQRSCGRPTKRRRTAALAHGSTAADLLPAELMSDVPSIKPDSETSLASLCIPLVPASAVLFLALVIGQASLAHRTGGTLEDAFTSVAAFLCVCFVLVYGPRSKRCNLQMAALRNRWEPRFLFIWRLLFFTFQLLCICDDTRRPIHERVARLHLLTSLAPRLILIYGSLGFLHGALPIPRDELRSLLAVQVALNVFRCTLLGLATSEWLLSLLGVCLGSISTVVGFLLSQQARQTEKRRGSELHGYLYRRVNQSEPFL